jgi:hypothetical protein
VHYEFKIRHKVGAAVPAREKYQRMAKRCLRAAEVLRDPAERKKLLEVAGAYMALARHVAERHDHGTAHRGPEHHPGRHHDA